MKNYINHLRGKKMMYYVIKKLNKQNTLYEPNYVLRLEYKGRAIVLKIRAIRCRQADGPNDSN